MSQTDTAPEQPPEAATSKGKRPYVSQTDVPSVSLEHALRVPNALAEQYGKRPATPLEVALALDMAPQGGQFKRISGAAIAYGLTEGGHNAKIISLTDLGRRVVAPTVEGDDVLAKREAFMRPRVVREFLERYDGSPLPSSTIARNVLESMGVPAGKTEATLNLIVEGAALLDLLAAGKDKQYVNLRATGGHLRAVPDETEDEPEEPDAPASAIDRGGAGGDDEPPIASADPPPAPDERNRNVFVSHGSNRKIVDQLKSMLEYGEFEPVVSVERETTAKPVPKKVFDDMGTCGAGIIHVAKEKTLIDSDGNEHHVLNENVLIEIGGAMALWGENFILLVEEGTKLPSNLQGMYEVRYQGTTLDADATMRLLKAFKSFKS